MDETDLTPTSSAGKPRLSEAIDYEREIAPYPLTMIYSGLGSGKNTLAGYLMNGNLEYDLPKLIVLLITSRKAKVVETLSDEMLDIGSGIGDRKTRKEVMEKLLKGHPFGLDIYRREIADDPRGCGSILQRSAACTNAFIEKYHQYVYDPNDPSTHLWNRFDVIIVDEVHALVTDSTYQSSPYHTMELVEQTVRRIMKARINEKKPPEERDPAIRKPVCQNVILMTGTPEAVRFLEAIPVMNLLDKRAECRNIAPQHLHLIDMEQALKQIREQLNAGERLIYFANHITPVEELARLYGLPGEKIAMQFSDEKRLNKLKRESERQKRAALKKGAKCPETEYEKLNRIQKQLATDELIDKEIQLFVTTSKNKEGININDKDIKTVYIEEHSLTDIRQMAGRLRNGAEHAYVIVDAPGHPAYENRLERWVTQKMRAFDLEWDNMDVLKANNHSHADAMLEQICAQNGIQNLRGNPNPSERAYSEDYPDVGCYIDLLQSKFPYLRYSFFTNSFQYNELRERGVDFAREEQQLFEKAMASDEAFLRIFGEGFPETCLHPMIDKERQALLRLQQVLNDHPDHRYTKAEKDQLGLELDLILHSEKDRKRRVSAMPQANRVLHEMGFHFEQGSHRTENARYDYWELRLWDGDKGLPLPKDSDPVSDLLHEAPDAA